LCKNGIKCARLFDYPMDVGVYIVGKCDSLDDCGRVHEWQHIKEGDCGPEVPGKPIHRAGVKQGVDKKRVSVGYGRKSLAVLRRRLKP
jgi:hypothetical protein